MTKEQEFEFEVAGYKIKDNKTISGDMLNMFPPKAGTFIFPSFPVKGDGACQVYWEDKNGFHRNAVVVLIKEGIWKLEGYDTFSDESYGLSGEYKSLEEAEKAAVGRLEEIEETQPSGSSGGQDGIQDRIYIMKPDGSKYLFVPKIKNKAFR